MKILHLDYETAYTVGAVWGMWETNVATVLSDEYILGGGYCWDHESAVHWKGLPDFPLYQKDKKSDRELVEFFAELVGEADVVVAHNGRAFDMKKLRARMLYHRLPPLNEPKIVDTKLEFKKKFSVVSNKLDELARIYLGERKVKHSGIDLWTRCMGDTYDAAAWKEMSTYCRQDVVLLKKLYALIVPWMDTPPNWNLEEDRPAGCPACGYPVYVKHGFRWNHTTVQQKYRCRRSTCRHMFSGKSVPRKYKEEFEKNASEDFGTPSTSKPSPQRTSARSTAGRKQGRAPGVLKPRATKKGVSGTRPTSSRARRSSR